MRLRIEPEPPSDVAAAIEAALQQLLARSARNARSLCYRDVFGDQPMSTLHLTWADAARLESLDSGV